MNNDACASGLYRNMEPSENCAVDGNYEDKSFQIALYITRGSGNISRYIWKIHYESPCLMYSCFRSLAFHLPHTFRATGGVTRDTKDNTIDMVFYWNVPNPLHLLLLHTLFNFIRKCIYYI